MMSKTPWRVGQLLTLLVALLVFRLPAFALEPPLVLNNVNLVDLRAGRIVPGQSVVIEGGSITRVTPAKGFKGLDNALVHDLDGRYLMPGLWDMHSHPESRDDLDLMLVNGVLGTRIMYGQPGHLAMRAEIELGQRPGPRLLIAGPIIEAPPPEELAVVIDRGKRYVFTPEEARAEARRQKAAGFDYLKVYNSLPLPTYDALVEEGERLGLEVIGHVPVEVGIAHALKKGQRSIEHLRGSIQVLVDPDSPAQPGLDLRSRTLAWNHIDESRVAALVRRTARSGAYHCPTLIARLFFSPTADVEAYLSRPEARFITPRFRNMLENRNRNFLSNFTEEDFEAGARGFAKQDRLMVALHDGGVPLLAGSDQRPWGFSLHSELELMVEAGLSPIEVLRAAVINPVTFAGLQDRMGFVGEGAIADLIVLRADPLQQIENTKTIQAVISRGDWLGRAELDRILARLE